MKKSEAEAAIRQLCTMWEKETGQNRFEKDFYPSFSAFSRWIEVKGYGRYLSFRSVMSPLYDAEMWFDDEFKQNWRR